LKNAVLIYNPIAGRHPARREKEIQHAAAALRQASIAARLVRTSGPGTARQLARAAVAEGIDLVIVCGGDGTINEVVNGVAPGPAALGILPGGTANIIAKELGLPHNLVRAAKELARWQPRRIALGSVVWANGEAIADKGQRFFLSVAGIGFDAYIVYKLSAAFKMSLGVVAYGWEAVRQALRYPFPVFRCRADGQERRATFAVVHRTQVYAGWFHLAPTANLFESRFTLCLFKSRHRERYFLYAAAAVVRQHLRLRDVELVDAQRIVCASEGQATIHFELDGEIVGRLPATFEIVPDALTLLVPWTTSHTRLPRSL
jgi:YegS/Rv2252/BmrU family lipid kinase